MLGKIGKLFSLIPGHKGLPAPQKKSSQAEKKNPTTVSLARTPIISIGGEATMVSRTQGNKIPNLALHDYWSVRDIGIG